MFYRTPLFTTPPLVSPKFPNVPLGLGGSFFWLQRANVPGKLSVQLVSKISKLCDHNPPTLQTDGRTDRRTDDMRSQD